MRTTQNDPAREGVVITGPQGSGKTRHAEALRAHFGLKYILDDGIWRPGNQVPQDTLVLTHEDAPEGIAIEVALAALQSPGS